MYFEDRSLGFGALMPPYVAWSIYYCVKCATQEHGAVWVSGVQPLSGGADGYLLLRRGMYVGRPCLFVQLEYILFDKQQYCDLQYSPRVGGKYYRASRSCLRGSCVSLVRLYAWAAFLVSFCSAERGDICDDK